MHFVQLKDFVFGIFYVKWETRNLTVTSLIECEFNEFIERRELLTLFIVKTALRNKHNMTNLGCIPKEATFL